MFPGELSIETLARNKEGRVVVWEAGGPILYLGNDKFFILTWPKTVLLSIVKAVQLTLWLGAGVRTGDEFLDCTLGLGADAIAASCLKKRAGWWAWNHLLL